MENNQDHFGFVMFIAGVAVFLVVLMIVQWQNPDSQDAYRKHQAGKRNREIDYYDHDAYMRPFVESSLWTFQHQFKMYETFTEDLFATMIMNLQNAYCEASEDFKELVDENKFGLCGYEQIPSTEELAYMKESLRRKELEFISTYRELPEKYIPYFPENLTYAVMMQNTSHE